ncbi:MAG: efflux RND transporter periplasmic adaptor subunit [Pseudomonadales bacterium]|nr:efflux RND transporter periplasmic adaptor subunit [Pseudomonadales bacterium]
MKIRHSILVIATFVLAPVVFADNGISRLDDIAIHPVRSAPATALSINEATLSAQILARVDSIEVGVSQQVSKGDLLLKLDCTDYLLALDTAKVALEIANARLELADNQKQRSERLLSKQLTSQESADTAQVDAIARRGEHAQAKLSLKKAEIEVNRCRVHAPYDGIVTERIVSVGQLASVGTPLVSIVETDKMELSAQVKPAHLAQLKNAKSIYFETDDRYSVRVMRLGGVVNTQTRNQEIRLRFEDQQPAPGAAGKLIWQDARFFVPAQYVVTRQGELGVFLARNGKAQFHALQGATPGRPALITLSGDEQIITSNLGQLVDGQTL